MKPHDETKLPKWAQQRLEKQRQQIRSLNAIRDASAVLCDWNWSRIDCPDESLTLFRLDQNMATAVCSISNGDRILIGRKRQ